MESIFLIIENVEGASGHGGTCVKYISLLHDGECFDLGTPAPAFSTYELAESFRVDNKFNSHHVIGMDVNNE